MAQAVTESDRSRVGLVTRRATPVARHARRFWLAYVALAVVLGVAVGGAVIALTDTSSKAKQVSSWSAWQPTERNSLGALAQIADHVGARYRLANGQQLAGVIPKVAAITSSDQQIPITAEIIHTGFPLDAPKDLKVDLIDRGAMYQLCGSGASCTIPGSPTLARGRLTRREGLELALYTFTYAPSVDTVLTFVPPTSANPNEKRVLVLHRGDLAPFLAKPLSATLKQSPKIKPDDITKSEKALVDRLTRFDFYTLKDSSQLPDGTIDLILYPPGT